jgi:SAM-dependent methyltransferase
MPQRPCPACGAAQWLALPDPGPHAMASDLRVLSVPLGKVACRACGLAMRREGAAGLDGLYGDGYALYAHAPGAPFEQARQAHYAAWIAGAMRARSRIVLDVGCGNGSLLTVLGELWPGVQLTGCDPSAGSVAHGHGSGLDVWQGTSATLESAAADLVVSVNVIEHTADPVAFLADLRRACTAAGSVIVVCPDGACAGVELLFADHLWSFTADHLRALAAAAGLEVRATLPAPAALGEFQMLVAAPAASPATTPVFSDPAGLNERRSSLLERWAALDGRLSSRLPAGAVCFGTGEAAGLLRAYAPVAWGRVRACTADAANGGRFGALPMWPIDGLPPDTPILVGVRPADQQHVAERLAGRFASITTWYDLLREP